MATDPVACKRVRDYGATRVLIRLLSSEAVAVVRCAAVCLRVCSSDGTHGVRSRVRPLLRLLMCRLGGRVWIRRGARHRDVSEPAGAYAVQPAASDR